MAHQTQNVSSVNKDFPNWSSQDDEMVIKEYECQIDINNCIKK